MFVFFLQAKHKSKNKQNKIYLKKIFSNVNLLEGMNCFMIDFPTNKSLDTPLI